MENCQQLEPASATEDVQVASPVAVGKRKRRRMEKRQEIIEKKLAAKRSRQSTNTVAETIEDSATLVERALKKESKLRAYEALCDENFAAVIDCDWESEHSEKALNSLAQQITFCYSVCRKSTSPCRIYLTGVGERLQAQLAKVASANWMGVSIGSADYRDIGTSKELVYLTSDGEETLNHLDSSCAYIIGGIVDRNRLKGATYEKATQQGIRTAKLPIKEYCTIKSTPVLTVNHVFEIMIRYSKCGSWAEAFECILPQRKGVSVPKIDVAED
ncbi:unnamed protein product, partial [Ectocarpus fasciculatus]